MKKILLIHSDNIHQPIGGLAIVIQNLIKYWNPDTELCIVGFGGEDEDFDNNVKYRKVKYTPIPNLFDSTLLVLAIQSAVTTTALKLCEDVPDLIVGCDWNTSRAIIDLQDFWQEKTNKEIPYIFWSHLSPSSYCMSGNLLSLTEEIIESQALELCDKVLHVSYGYAQRFPFPIYANKTKVIPNGINFSEFQFKGENPYTNPKHFNILYLGRATVQKNIPNLLECTLPENVSLTFAIGNNGISSKEMVERVTTKCGQEDNFHYIGEIRGDVKSNYLNHADALIIPSNSEPFGIVGLEGMVSNCLIISTMVEGLGDFINESFAVRIKPDENHSFSSKQISSAIEEAVSIPIEQRVLMVNNGFAQAIANYQWASIVPKSQGFFLNTIQ